MGKIAVIGAGSWGTALAQTLAAAGNEVVMWARKPEVADAITKEHHNPRYLNGVMLSDSISATSNLQKCAEHAEALVIVTPSRLTRQFAQDLAPDVEEGTPIVVCSKGVEEGTGLLPVQVFEEVLGNIDRLAALSGPNHAEEVILGVPAGTVIASRSKTTAHYFRDLFTTSYFRCYTSPDYVGVELCAAFKNVIAIANGMSVAMQLGDNASSSLLTRGLAEVSRLVVALGGDARTCLGLAGVGDLIATCSSEHSRNRALGAFLVEGGTLAAFEEKMQMVAEGAVACKTVTELARQHDVEMPIAEAVRQVLWEGRDPHEIIETLFERPVKAEQE